MVETWPHDVQRSLITRGDAATSAIFACLSPSRNRAIDDRLAPVMPCTPNDYMRLLGLVESNVVMHFYFTDGTYIRGYVARAELDPISRSGLMLLVVPESNRVIQVDAGDLLMV